MTTTHSAQTGNVHTAMTRAVDSETLADFAQNTAYHRLAQGLPGRG